MYFLRLFDICTADPDALFVTLVPPQEGGGELRPRDRLQHPIPSRSEALLGQSDARQLFFHLGEEEEVRRREIRRIRRVLDHLVVVGGEPISDNGGGINRGIHYPSGNTTPPLPFLVSSA